MAIARPRAALQSPHDADDFRHDCLQICTDFAFARVRHSRVDEASRVRGSPVEAQAVDVANAELIVRTFRRTAHKRVLPAI